MHFLNFFPYLDEGASSAASGGGGGGFMMMILYMVLIFGALYFIMIRPQRKKQKAEEKMRNDVQVGDSIVTIGGIHGRVVSIKEDTLTIESPVDHGKITLEKWSIQSNLTQHEAEALEKPQKQKKAKKRKREDNEAGGKKPEEKPENRKEDADSANPVS